MDGDRLFAPATQLLAVLSWAGWEAAESGLKGTCGSFFLECFPHHQLTVEGQLLAILRHWNKSHHLQEALLDLLAKVDLPGTCLTDSVLFSHRSICCSL